MIIRCITVASVALAVVVGSPLAGAQAKPTPAASPTPTARPAAEKAVVVPLVGLTKESTAGVEQALKDLRSESWACAACGYAQGSKGACPECEEALTKQSSASLTHVAVKEGAVSFGLAPGGSVTLSQLERALAPAKATVDRERVSITDWTILVVSGAPDKLSQAASLVGKADLFDRVAERSGASKGEHWLVIERAGSPQAMADVKAGLKPLGLTVEDVRWAAPCSACAKQGLEHAGCPACLGPAPGK